MLYHCELLTRGYLGVDIFFVINGYFLMKGYLKRREESTRDFFKELIAKIVRLWPLIIILSFIVMAIGFFAMLPDDYENLAESVIASNAFLNNVLGAITTKNYWNIANNYKPLMHLWFVGVLLQSQLFLSIFFRITGKKSKKNLGIGVVVLTIVSLTLYFLPVFSSATKFYYFPFRLFEILFGSIIALIIDCKVASKLKKEKSVCFLVFSIALLLLFLIVDTAIPDEVYLVGIALAAAVTLLSIEKISLPEIKLLKPLSKIGVASYSIYIVHQPVIAFTRYLFTSSISGLVFIIVVFITAVLSVLAYRVEKVSLTCSKNKNIIRYFIICISFVVVICGFSGFIYLKAGVVRDIPELNVYKETAYRGMHAEYVDVPYQWDRDFSNDEKVHILVIGDSMARDWCNILNESKDSEKFEISYIYTLNLCESKFHRFEESDYIFYATIGDAVTLKTDILNEYSTHDNFWVVGIKNFGENNGQIYRKRHSPDYFDSSIFLGRTTDSKIKYFTFLEQNEAQKNKYGDHYIDMIAAVQNKNGSIPIFTDTQKFISADTEHLTQDGAEYYSRILDLSWIHK